MSEKISLRMAMPSSEEFKAFIDFMQGLDECPSYSVKDWVDENYPKIESSWRRVLWAGKTAIDNACDPELDYLDWKPEIKNAVEAFQDSEPTEAW